MTRLIAAFAFFIITLSQMVYANQTIFVVEIADFHCKYCLESEAYVDFLKGEVSDNNDEFIFAPLAFNRQDKTMELFYYALKNDKQLEPFAREEMFNIAQISRLKISSFAELLDWVNISFSNTKVNVKKIENLLLENTNTFENIKSYLKAESLAAQANIEQTPTFLIISSESGITKVKRSPDMSVKDYIDQTLQTYLRISKNES